MASKIKKAIRKVKNFRVGSTKTIVSSNLTRKNIWFLPTFLPNTIRGHPWDPTKRDLRLKKRTLGDLGISTYLDSIRLIVSGLDDQVLSSPFGCVAFYQDAFDTKVWLSLHAFIMNVLDFYKVTLTQFSLNDFKIIISFILIYNLVEIEPRHFLFLTIFMLKSYPYDKDWYYFVRRQSCKLVEGILTFIHGWKNKYFFIFLYQSLGIRSSWGKAWIERTLA